MNTTTRALDGLAAAPEYLATQTAIAILREGGTAIEAVVAAAATIAVVYGHLNSLGSDGFFLIVPPEGEPFVIDGSGPAGSLVSRDDYPNGTIPMKGPKAAITMAGTISGWKLALDYLSLKGQRNVSLDRLLADAIKYAEQGYPVSAGQAGSYNFSKANGELTEDVVNLYGEATQEGQILKQPRLANTLKYLARNGLDSFYRGGLAKYMAEQMKNIGIPITEEDFSQYNATFRIPLQYNHSKGILYNTPPPTQGLVSLIILAILDQYDTSNITDELLIHITVEATKLAFVIRDQYITDPRFVTVDPQTFLTPQYISSLAAKIRDNATDFNNFTKGPADTVWLGAVDKYGYSVSFIQSLTTLFGSGVEIPGTGILWHNRGIEFSLDNNSILALEPGKKPFHTLNPAAAKLNDGRILVYGTSGGNGQPQTQAAVFTRYVVQGIGLQQSLNLPRWVYGPHIGRGEGSDLVIEDRFSDATINGLKDRGQNVIVLPSFAPDVGQAGVVVRRADGVLEGAFDPRADSSAAGF